MAGPIIAKVGDWNLFFGTTAASAATLVGLLFVATQLHMDVFTDPKSRWAALAQSTLTILAVDFALSLFMIMPGLALPVRGQVILVIVLFGLYRSVRIWWPVVRVTEHGRRHRIAQSFWLLFFPLLAYAYLASGGVGLWRNDASAILNVGAALLTLFGIALRNAWRLAVQTQAERQ